MGRFFKKKTNGEQKNAKSDDWRGSYAPIAKENSLLESYYSMMIPVEEQAAFWATLRSPLPATFRMVATPDFNAFQEEMKTDPLFGCLEKVPFVPRAWKAPVSRYELRKGLDGPNGNAQSALKEEDRNRLHKWLTSGTEAGAICRQEAVSMIPPLLLDISRPDLFILDMCAAPGSKTGQLLEYLHECRGNGAVTGMVIANDADRNRAFMLHSQVRRLHSPAILICNTDASRFPTIKDDQGKLLFDRVLCDVPCSGDGTLRKTPSIWRNWTPNQAFGLHPLQRRILERGLQLLKTGGRLVYSTCSLNPVEDEAVVAEVLRRMRNEVQLVDCSERLPELRKSSGKSEWPVMTSDGKLHEGHSADSRLMRSFFPPTKEEAEWMHLDRAFRVLPHHQDTGGFFLAVFERTGDHDDPFKKNSSEFCDDRSSTPGAVDAEPTSDSAEHLGSAGHADAKGDGKGQTKRKRMERFSLDTFHVIDPLENASIQSSLSWYLHSDCLPGTLLSRSADALCSTTPRNLVLVTPPIARIIASSQYRSGRMAVVNAGVRAFERYEPSAKHADDVYACPYRVLSELIASGVIPLRSFRTVELRRPDFELLVKEEGRVDIGVGTIGGMVAQCEGLWAPVWKTGDGGVKVFLTSQDRQWLLSRLRQ